MDKIKTSVFVICFLFNMAAFPAKVIKNTFWGDGDSLVFDHQGNMYIGYDSYSIAKYSPDGKLLLKIGRKGEGPGDIKRIGSYAFNPKDKTLYVTEYYKGNRRVSRFTTDGKFPGSWNFEMNWSKYDIVDDIAFDNEGNVLLIAEKRNERHYKDFILSNKVCDLLKFSPGGKFLKTIYTFNTDSDASKPGNFQVTIPFQNALSWIVYQDKIIVKEISGNVINIYSPDGELEKQIPFPVKNEKVTEKDLDAWEKRLKSLPFIKKLKMMGNADVDYWRKSLTFPKYKPNSSWKMLTDSKGNLYVREYTRYKNKDPDWYRINLQTGKIDTLTFKPGEALLRIWNDYFFIYKLVEKDGEEIEMITRFTEKELLNR